MTPDIHLGLTLRAVHVHGHTTQELRNQIMFESDNLFSIYRWDGFNSMLELDSHPAHLVWQNDEGVRRKIVVRL